MTQLPYVADNTTDEHLEIAREWLTHAVNEWKRFNWRRPEAEFNSFPRVTASFQHKSHDFTCHFLALFSKKTKAVPVVFSHHWPGSVIEFLLLHHHLCKIHAGDGARTRRRPLDRG
ncbi:epoxide hydrolase N terminus-domain-containing protein [Papiliotrema laurentii]|uniref:Epoxide hydrolase N terminus-domain-containing protein n=1 Tax=Papiliotrema laurentii TaxID=5418 RepID=A0AAD9CTW5_PAPLA|nr:epoxide hydrolase N terminus-domain-containing protein [Papiliotrema laurentii]